MISIIGIYVFLASVVIFYILIINKNKLPVQVPPLLPGPTPWPIVGCVPQMLRNKPASTWIHGLMEQFNTDILCIRLGNVHTIVVKSPELAREFLKKHDAVFTSRPVTIASHLVSDGYLTTGLGPKGEQWKKMRRALLTVFNQSRIRWLLNKRNEEADNLVKFIYKQCSKSENGSMVNVRYAAQHYSLDVMRRMFFGTSHFGKGRKDGGPGFEEERHLSGIFTLNLHVFGFCVSDYLPWLKPFDIDGHKKTIKSALKIVKENLDPIIDERVEKWRCFNQKIGIKEPIEEDLLDVFILLKDENGHPLLSAKEIKAQITASTYTHQSSQYWTLFSTVRKAMFASLCIFMNYWLVATVDTPFTIAEWGLSEMMNQPAMLKKAQEELDKVVGVNMLVQESHLPRLSYIRACARETLRLHPVAPFNVPRASIDDAIVGGYFIPKGSCVLLSRIALRRNPKIGENPLKFDPERHLRGDNSKQVELEERDLNFISFSIGRRGCTGSTLGTNIALMLFARLLQGFTWSMTPEVDMIDLTEAHNNLFKLDPLNVLAKPRLDAIVYPI